MSKLTSSATRRAQPGALALAAFAGASAWISLGVLAVMSEQGLRLGLLPPLWAMVAGLVTGVVIAGLIRLRTADAWPLGLTAVLWLPWLPWAIPPAVFAFDGPLEIVIWCAAGGGVAAAWLSQRGRWPQWAEPRRAPWVLAGVTLACSVGGFVALRERLPGGDEPHYLIITQSLLKDGDLRIENNHDRGDYLDYHAKTIPPDFLRRGVDGQIYSIHAPGLSVLLLPAFAFAGYHGAVGFISVLSAIALALLWRAAYLVTSSAPSAWAATAAIGCSAPFYFHTFVIFPDAVGAVVVAVLVGLLVAFDTAPAVASRWFVGGAGLLLGVLPWLHTRFALIAASAGVCVVARVWRGPDRLARLATFALGTAICAVAWFWSFWIVYGTINPAAPYGGSRQTATAWMPNGVTGLLFDQQFGMLSNAPVMMLVPVGLFLMWPARLRLAVELAAVAIPYAAMVTSFGMWWGGWSAPARFLVPLVPLAAPALAYAWRDGGPVMRSAIAGLTFIGAANIVGRVVAADGSLLYNQRDGYDRLLDWVSRTVNLPLAMPAIHRQPIEMAVLLGGIWVGSAMAALFAIFALGRLRPSGVGSRWALTCVAGIIAAGSATSASWGVTGASPLTPEASKVDLLQRWKPDTQRLAIRLPSLSLASPDEALDAIRLHSSERAPDVFKGDALFAVSRLPAGDYRVEIEGANSLAGRLTASVGVTTQTIESWSLDGLDRATSDLTLRLPVPVYSLVIDGDAVARSRVTQVLLKPLHFGVSHANIQALAIRASRYGHARGFFLDDAIYMEPVGFWTGGNTSAKLVLSSDEEVKFVDVDVRAGPLPSVVVARVGDWSTRVELGAGEHRLVTLPVNALVSLETSGGFRPVDHDPGSTDRRLLGVRIEFPERQPD